MVPPFTDSESALHGILDRINPGTRGLLTPVSAMVGEIVMFDLLSCLTVHILPFPAGLRVLV